MTLKYQKYTGTYRRLLVDMHIPEWDERFLQEYDPGRISKACRDAQITGVMLYFQSHVGLCNWPTASGKQHARFVGRDVIGETLEEFRKLKIPACAYYSVNFNNWAYLEHPDWRLEPATKGAMMGFLPRERYGVVCLNNPDYREFVHTQAAEIMTGYDIDAFFYDMVWWMGVCLCRHCLSRYKDEMDAEIPKTIDWLDPAWCQYQTTRESWLTEFAAELRDHVQQLQAECPVYHNFAVGMANWSRGVSFSSARAHDFLGGDFYGGRDQQFLVSRLMINLSETRPVEFMTTIAANLSEHECLQQEQALQLKACAATSCGAAFLLIAAINPDGSINQTMYDLAGESFRQIALYEPYLGGIPVEDIGVYFSSESKMNFVDNGKPVIDVPTSSDANYPHARAVAGACRILQQAHIPFGVITSKQLPELDKYKVVVLPNILRMTQEEVTAFRTYVGQGGKLYASRYTSLTDVDGKRHDDFMLNEVFACHYDSMETGNIIYVKPKAEELITAITPQQCVSHWRDEKEMTGAIRLSERNDAEVLATLTLPYGYPEQGRVDTQDWASIHSFPPWENTTRPALVKNSYGQGEAVYSAADIESGRSAAHEQLFLSIVRSLLDSEPSFEAETHPAVWMTVFRQTDRKRLLISFLNYQTELPVIPIRNIAFRLKAVAGMRFTRLLHLPDEQELEFNLGDKNTLHASMHELGVFEMFAAEYSD